MTSPSSSSSGRERSGVEGRRETSNDVMNRVAEFQNIMADLYLQQAEADEVLHHLATDYRLMLASVDRALAERRRTLRELQRETKRHSGAKVEGLVGLRILCRTMMRRSLELPRLTSIRRARP